jgi:hypothetical protein
MSDIVSNPYFQVGVGAVVSFVGSVIANFLFYGRMEQSRARRESERAYNKLVVRLLHTTISDINHPFHFLPVDIADRVEDLKFALADVNPKFQYMPLVQKAIAQSAELRKKQEKLQAEQCTSPTQR